MVRSLQPSDKFARFGDQVSLDRESELLGDAHCQMSRGLFQIWSETGESCQRLERFVDAAAVGFALSGVESPDCMPRQKIPGGYSRRPPCADPRPTLVSGSAGGIRSFQFGVNFRFKIHLLKGILSYLYLKNYPQAGL
jgi:hypothetical protein